MSKCAVLACQSDKRELKENGETLQFFSFPKDKHLCKKWVRKCNFEHFSELRYRYPKICSKHFQLNDYEDAVESERLKSLPKMLKPDAIPSLFLNASQHEEVVRNDVSLVASENHDPLHQLLAQEIASEKTHNLSKLNSLPLSVELMESEKIDGVPEQKKTYKKRMNKTKVTDHKEEPSELRSGDIRTECCYVCGKRISQSYKKKYSVYEFAHIIRNLLEDVAPGYVMVVRDEDGLCDQCGDLTMRISTLEERLHTHNLALRALLRLKYSLPFGHQTPPIQEKITPVKLQQSKATTIKNSTIQTDRFLNDHKMNQGSGLPVRNKSTQMTPLVRHKQIQTKESCLLEEFKSKILNTRKTPNLVITNVHSLDQLENFEAKGLGETDEAFFPTDPHLEQSPAHMEENNHLFEDIGNESYMELENEDYFLEKGGILKDKTKSKNEIQYVSTVEEIEKLEALALGETDEQTSLTSDVHLEQFSRHIEENNLMFEDISNKSELKLDNEMHFVEKRTIVANNKNKADGPKESKQPTKKIKKANKSIGILRCGRCSFKTRSAEEMKTHMLSFKNKEGFYCNICDYAYHNKYWYEKHAMGHSETSKDKRCFFCDKIVHDELHMRFHIEETHRENSFSHRCSLCKRVFMFAGHLRKHKRKIHKVNIEILECDKCDKKFYNDKVKYDNHVNFYHRDSLVCKFCQRVCPTIEKLIYHENNVHRYEKKDCYQCSYCPRKFLRHERMFLHEEHHTGQYEFRCDLCGYGEFDEESLRKHMNTCKTILHDSRFCPKRLKRQRESYAHQSLVCDVCGKIITTIQKYKIHRELHDNPPGFQCELCGKKFRYKNNMQVHMRNLHLSPNKNVQVDDESKNVSEVDCTTLTMC